jgi:hypothetical protein
MTCRPSHCGHQHHAVCNGEKNKKRDNKVYEYKTDNPVQLDEWLGRSEDKGS